MKQDVNFICDLDPEIYGRIVPSIQTLHVIVTDKQLEHIKERHPDISETVMERLAEVILSPDYIIETEMPNTANILKRLEFNGKNYQLVLRIRTESDPQEFQNSIITFATVYKGNIIKNLIMDCQSYTKYRPNETTGGIFVSWRRKEELPTGA